MNPRIDSLQRPAGSAPRRPAAPTSPAPAATRPGPARDQLSLSRPELPLERLKTQLEGPLPPPPALTIGTDWKQNDQRLRSELIKTLLQDEPVRAGLKAWKGLPQDLRIQLGDRISAIQAQIYGFKPVRLRAEDGPYRGGFHPANGGEITIGPKSMVSASEFLNTVVHEQTHALQWEKGDAAIRKKLDPSDPYAGIAMTWMINFDAYTPPAKGYRAYREQPVEAHAFATGDAVAAAVLSKK